MAIEAAVGCTVALCALLVAPIALAGPPVHPPLPALEITGLNHACGVATDSEGDVYAASAGEAKVYVFDGAHHQLGEQLAEITNAHEPCGLAVDSQGNLYVSERATGEVVRYQPTKYPFTGSPSYEAPMTVDASGNAAGIAADPSDDSLYVAEGNRVMMYSSEGTPGVNELQRVDAGETGGSYTLSFEGQETGSLPREATHAEIQSALEGLSTIGPGNVSVTQAPGAERPENHLVTFKGALAGTDVGQVVCPGCPIVATIQDGEDGKIGEGQLADATGVASYTSPGSTNLNRRRYISVSEPTVDEIKVFVGHFAGQPAGFSPTTLEARATIDGSDTPAGELGLGLDASLGIDPESGHIFSYDATNNVVNEFEATGKLFAQVNNAGFIDAEPTALAVDRSGGSEDGTLYVTSGSGAGAEALAFGPVFSPARPELGEPPGQTFTSICGTAVDSNGDVYAAGEANIKVYGPSGSELASIADPKHPCSLAVDSEGNLYVVNRGPNTAATGDESVVRYEPNAYPLPASPKYTERATVDTSTGSTAIAVDPVNRHLFVGFGEGLREYGSAAEGSPLVSGSFCIGHNEVSSVAVYGVSGDVYISGGNSIKVCSADGTKVVSVIDGTDSFGGTYPPGFLNGTGSGAIAVDQANGHVLVGTMHERGYVEEYEASGAFVGKYGVFPVGIFGANQLAVDNSGGSTDGRLYVAYNGKLTALGPVNYGEAPGVVTGTASAIHAGEATLNGTVDPHGFELEECVFEWAEAEQPFGPPEPCEETPFQIGKGIGPVPVHLRLLGISPETTRYRFRLRAKNRFGESEGKEAIFGPPVLTERSPQPVFYKEATLRGEVDPSGLATEYRFEYGLGEGEYEASTETQTLAASAGPTQVQTPIVGLAEGTTYHFRLVAENDAGVDMGLDQELTTQQKHPALQCPNETLRLENNSSRLPDCRAYELVTPADTRGMTPNAGANPVFNDWLVTPDGPSAGESLAFHFEGTLPGTEGNGLQDYFRATRGSTGWQSNLFGPNFTEAVEETGATVEEGISANQLYSFWLGGSGSELKTYLRTPEGFEVLGQGSLDQDPAAAPKFISPDGSHVLFASETNSGHTAVRLEPAAPEPPIGSIYDRGPGGPTQVVSVPPAGASPQLQSAFETHSAVYQGASPDGTSVVFEVNGDLYLRRSNSETFLVTEGPASFAGISDDGKHVFDTDSTAGGGQGAAGLWVFNVEGETRQEITASGEFVDIPAEGTSVYFISEEDLTGTEENQLEEEAQLGAHNLYLWDGSDTTFVAVLSPNDVFHPPAFQFPGTNDSLSSIALDSWTASCVRPQGLSGRAACPSRATTDGHVLVFQSHANLKPKYEGNGHSNIYRYDAEDESLLCVSCDPSGAPGVADADLESFNFDAPTLGQTLIPSVTDDGNAVVFQTTAALLPEDANSVLDVYEWQADGTGGCQRQAGCLALISSGQGGSPSYIYSMTPSGNDVFFETQERLIGSDVAASPSLYDARVGGGFPQFSEAEPCHGDACQGEAGTPPSRPTVTSQVPNAGNHASERCPKGRRLLKGRCVARHHRHKRHHKHRSRRAHRRGRITR
jgi:sugar lactone lactonase YvrE